jgi:hypothetical protein
MEDKGTYRWLDLIDGVMETYLSRKHSSIGLSPSEAIIPSNANIVKKHLFGSKSRYKKLLTQPVPNRKIAIGNYVRVSTNKKIPFQKESADLNFSVERFLVTNIDRSEIPYTYKLQDQLGLPVNMSFYIQELTQVVAPLITDKYKIEYIIKKTRNKSYVKWEGFPINQATWELTKNIENLF